MIDFLKLWVISTAFFGTLVLLLAGAWWVITVSLPLISLNELFVIGSLCIIAGLFGAAVAMLVKLLESIHE